MAKGCFYRNEMWFSPAYQRLTIGARDLLQCLYTEIRKTKVNRKWKEFRNGESILHIKLQSGMELELHQPPNPQFVFGTKVKLDLIKDSPFIAFKR